MIQTPLNQRRHTNVAVVRLKKGKQRFELAAYPNKVLAWRQKLETDLGEVLQSQMIYLSVSQGLVANSKQLEESFGKADTGAIISEILEKGELQVAEKERQALLNQMFKDVATLVAQMAVHPDTKRPYPVSMIERAMKDNHIAVLLNKSAKQQALDTFRALQKTMPVTRARMLVRLFFSSEVDAKRVELPADKVEITEPTKVLGNRVTFTCLVDPSFFRRLDASVSEVKGAVELLDGAAFEEGERRLDQINISATSSSASGSGATSSAPPAAETLGTSSTRAEDPEAGCSPGVLSKTQEKKKRREAKKGGRTKGGHVSSDESDEDVAAVAATKANSRKAAKKTTKGRKNEAASDDEHEETSHPEREEDIPVSQTSRKSKQKRKSVAKRIDHEEDEDEAEEADSAEIGAVSLTQEEDDVSEEDVLDVKPRKERKRKAKKNAQANLPTAFAVLSMAESSGGEEDDDE